MLPKSLDPEALRNVAAGALVVQAILAFLVLRFVRKMVVRVVLLGAIAGLALFAWYQREELRECVPDCACSFFGYDVQTPGCPPPS